VVFLEDWFQLHRLWIKTDFHLLDSDSFHGNRTDLSTGFWILCHWQYKDATPEKYFKAFRLLIRLSLY